ncbi:hypothetical protein DIURU_004392 [Diutina rugosa]|uniref:Luciferase-like domain-containing protein n=1 Tax=Diutina rugosa TaxID=5481 RepID=A0A642UM57_DIURU|nr:uncharacterized protein DIURU_004392 [Diutina rugosa]KAA8899370.1 hypothetical protein DIURU_004392 [Diutina rugosa]
MTKERKPLILNAFQIGGSGLQAPGLWKHPDDRSSEYTKLKYWTDLAKLLEKGKFNGLFIADVLGGYDVYNGPQNFNAAAASGAQFPVNEPSAPVTAMAAVTDHLTFGLTFSTIAEPPYHLARRLATLDHLTDGRVGWNVVTSYLDSAARNLLDGAQLPPHDKRYARAEEYLQVVYKLLVSSWRDDAVVLKDGIYSDPERIRLINHQGEFFTVPGPNFTEPSPQKLPLIIQAGSSKQGLEFAGKNAEVVFHGGPTPEKLGERIRESKEIAKKYGRGDDLKFLTLITIILGETHEEAEQKYHEYRKYGDVEGAKALLSGWTGIDFGKFPPDEEVRNVEGESNAGSSHAKALVDNWQKLGPGDPPDVKKTPNYVGKQITIGGMAPVFWGTATEVADEIERWVDISGVDGFNITYATLPGSYEDIVKWLIPELQRRKLVWDDYPEKPQTYREQVFGRKFVNENHPAYDLRWTPEYTKEEFEAKLAKLEAQQAANADQTQADPTKADAAKASDSVKEPAKAAA